jgi:hypothetical protein
VAFFASCGSSPENWLQNERVFHTRCGYREKTPTTEYFGIREMPYSSRTFQLVA